MSRRCSLFPGLESDSELPSALTTIPIRILALPTARADALRHERVSGKAR